jgi:pyridoxal phosphate enzyme (YggS family)
VTLVAVTKTASAACVEALFALGVRDFGESRVQEAKSKHNSLSCPGARWHMIGRLQTNKVRVALSLFDVVHSLDRDELVDALGREAARGDRVVDCFLQVNVSGESSKGGFAPAAVGDALKRARSHSALRVRGLMAIPAPAADVEGARAPFRVLRNLRDALRNDESELVDLSMGMSHDFTVATEEGATLVRVGSALFSNVPDSHFGRGVTTDLAANGNGDR